MYEHPLIVHRRSRAGAPDGAALRAWKAAVPWRRVPRRALVDFTRSLAVMVGARLTLVEALETAETQCRHERLRTTVGAVRRQVQGGSSLSDGFAAHPDVFDRLFVHLTRVGEAAGVLDQVLLRLAVYLEQAAALRRKVRTAVTYPALVLCVAAGATIFLLAAIVPAFADMYADFGGSLPAPTRLVMQASRGISRYGWGAALATVVAGAAVASWRRTAAGRRRMDRFVLALPLIGAMLRKNLVARCCRTLGTLLASGVPLVESLGILAHTAGNQVFEAEIEHLLAHVRRGSSLHAPLRHAQLFPAMVVQMIAVGEQTAELDGMLLHAAAHYEQEVEAAVETLTSALEPVLIVVVGVLLGGLLMAMYLPMFDLIDVVG